MKVAPVAFDSFGVRSMATYVEADEKRIFIDPGVALGPTRYGLGPTKEEFRALELEKQLVMELAEKCEIVIVTHYHYDHHPYPDDSEMYERCFKGKIVLAKDIHKNINKSGMQRGKKFEEIVQSLAKELIWADGGEFEFGNVKIRISPAVWHGDVGSRVGMVIMASIEESEEKFLHGSDAQSLADPNALDWVLKENPDFMILDGYPTIFVGWRMKKSSFEAAKENLRRAVLETKAHTILLEHHILRDIKYKEKLADLFEAAETKGKRILTAAEYYGLENFFLEAWRKELHEGKRTVDVDAFFQELRKRILEILGE